MSLKKKIGNSILSVLSKTVSQSVWEKLFRLSLRQMNYGRGGDFNQSGELAAAKMIAAKYARQKNIVVFDVGANKGNYAVALADIFGSDATVYAFEPSQQAYTMLQQSIQNRQNVVAVNKGCSDRETVQSLYGNYEGSSWSSLYQRKLDHFNVEMKKTEEISLTTIDKFCSDNRISHIHFLKIDIEGHEMSALKGATAMLTEKKINCIQFEFGGCNIDSRTYFQDFYYLLKDDFTIYRIVENGLQELPAYKETYEIFITINYLAIRK